MASIKNAMIYFPGHQGKINNIIIFLYEVKIVWKTKE